MGIFDALFGDGGEKDIRRAGADARERIERGKRESIDTRNRFLDRSVSFFEPGISVGRNALADLAFRLGPEGDEEAFRRSLDTGIEAIDRSASARGLRNAGGTQRELFDFGQRRRLAFDDAQNRLRLALAGIGSGEAGQAASQTFSTGSQIADTEFGEGQLLANNLVNVANAAAQAAQNPINNLIALLSAGGDIAKAASGFDFGGGTAAPSPRVDAAGRILGPI